MSSANSFEESIRDRLPADFDLRVKNLSGELVPAAPTPIGFGAFADVYKYKPVRSGSNTQRFYAVKSFRQFGGTSRPTIPKKVLKEAYTWVRLSHPNIHRLHGYLYRDGCSVPCLVSDFRENGTARCYIAREDFQPVLFWKFIRGIARGLSYLHKQGVVHRDLKGDNVLVSDNGDALLADFGLSAIIDPEQAGFTMTSSGHGAWRWTAAEYFDFENGPKFPTMAGDVWMFGSTCLELWSGQVPYHGINDLRLPTMIKSGELPTIPPTPQRSDFQRYKERVEALCTLCWVRDPKNRPRINVLLAMVGVYCFEEDPRDDSVNDLRLFPYITPGSQSSNDSGIDLTTETGQESGRYRPSAAPMSYTSDNTATPILAGLHISTDYRYTTSPQSLSPDDSPLNTPLGADAFGLNRTAGLPWSKLPPPPSPSVESLLRFKNISAQQALNHRFANQKDLIYKPNWSIDETGQPVHTLTCLIRGEEYGSATAKTKQEAKEMAALRALEKLCYRRLLTKKGSGDDIVLADGVGMTQEEAYERASQNAARAWISAYEGTLKDSI
ncbi:hypothetical protein M0805_001266 [Coniferiporia weirii]|nr:hypothetical protein M0805_001266 [Coniferiporia weirii]